MPRVGGHHQVTKYLLLMLSGCTVTATSVISSMVPMHCGAVKALDLDTSTERALVTRYAARSHSPHTEPLLRRPLTVQAFWRIRVLWNLYGVPEILLDGEGSLF
jgi:hypothetical protein